MGRESTCTARFSWIERGAKRAGKALLEENELLFRGEPRVKLSRGEITGLAVDGDELVVEAKLGTARFDLGATEAERWRARFLSPPSLMDKLGIKSGCAVAAVGPVPAEVLRGAASAGAKVGKAAGTTTQVVLLAARTEKELERVVALAPKLEPAARLWVLYPRGKAELPESTVRKVVLATGLVDNKTARVDDVWTSLQFVVRKANRK
jgi:hypothetical protein